MKGNYTLLPLVCKTHPNRFLPKMDTLGTEPNIFSPKMENLEWMLRTKTSFQHFENLILYSYAVPKMHSKKTWTSLSTSNKTQQHEPRSNAFLVNFKCTYLPTNNFDCFLPSHNREKVAV